MHNRHTGRSPFTRRQLVIGIVLALVQLPTVSAHEGPPFPILMDKPAAGHVVSVWADPDIGEAQFFIVVESPAGGPPRTAPEVTMWVEPVSGRLDRTIYRSEQQTLRNQMQFEASPYFDQRDLWKVGFQVTTSGGESQELTTQIESTPPGYGFWGLGLYLFPFVFLGVMWVIAMFRGRRTKLIQSKTRVSLSEYPGRDQELVESVTDNGA